MDIFRKFFAFLFSIPKRIVGSRNERLLKHYSGVVRQINALEAQISELSDAVLRGKTAEFRKRIAEGATLDELLPEAFAVVREAGKRALRMRHFDVQLVGGMVLHDGKIAEMRTGNGVHIVTVNDYLAKRDAEWMGKLYGFLGLTVGVNIPQMEPDEKRKADRK